jgi:ribosomal protein L37E
VVGYDYTTNPNSAYAELRKCGTQSYPEEAKSCTEIFE